MPILKLHLENVGPFDALDLDFTDGKGNAHLGPHILTGVNGSGKTTVLKAIAACLAEGVRDSLLDRVDHGFSFAEDWHPRIRGRKGSRCSMQVGSSTTSSWEILGPTEKSKDPHRTKRPNGKAPFDDFFEDERVYQSQEIETQAILSLGCVATYSPQPRLRWLDELSFEQDTHLRNGWLSFDSTVDNRRLQNYWVDCFSREALSSAKGVKAPQGALSVEAMRKAVRAIFDGAGPSGSATEPIVSLEGRTRPALRFNHVDLDFSQLPSGVNATLSWVVDYLMRRDAFRWRDEQSGRRKPGVILIDEIETHLHPQWQRSVLNGIREAFRDTETQIIVTTHSPFVVSSCPDARLHKLNIDDEGKAGLDESVDAPDAASLMANVMDVFGIQSEFGPGIEKTLSRWSELKRRQAAKKISRAELTELRALAAELSAQGEELALIVREPAPVREDLVSALEEAVAKQS